MREDDLTWGECRTAEQWERYWRQCARRARDAAILRWLVGDQSKESEEFLNREVFQKVEEGAKF